MHRKIHCKILHFTHEYAFVICDGHEINICKKSRERLVPGLRGLLRDVQASMKLVYKDDCSRTQFLFNREKNPYRLIAYH